jgi:hypothetical protein
MYSEMRQIKPLFCGVYVLVGSDWKFTGKYVVNIKSGINTIKRNRREYNDGMLRWDMAQLASVLVLSEEVILVDTLGR